MIISALVAGMMIGIGGIANVTVGGIAGSVLFCVGLLTVLYFQLDLVTGKAGLVPVGEYNFFKLLVVMVFNFVGAWLIGKLYSYIIPADIKGNVVDMVVAKNTAGHVANFIRGIFCGILMFVAVTSYKVTGKVVLTCLAVSTFVLLKASHCVADMLYLSVSGIDFGSYLFMGPVIVGNFVGCMAIPTLSLITIKKKD